jgi:hypothetical protein
MVLHARRCAEFFLGASIMGHFFFVNARRAIMPALLLGAALTFGASGGAAPLSPAQAVDDYSRVLSRMVDAAEAVHDAASARRAMRAFADGTRARIEQDIAIEAMPPRLRAAYERLVAQRQSEIGAKRARFEAALARMTANAAYVQALAEASSAAPR